MYESYFTVSKSFPEYRPLIQHLFHTSHVFRQICIDYHKCFKALHYWSKSSSQEAPLRNQEYVTLLSELSQEILQYVRLFNKELEVNTQANKGENGK